MQEKWVSVDSVTLFSHVNTFIFSLIEEVQLILLISSLTFEKVLIPLMSPFAGLEDSPLDKPSQVNGKNSVQEVGTSSA